MLSWWVWLVIWAVLVLGGALLLFVLGRRTWRSFRGLTGELHQASMLAAAIEREAATPNVADPAPPRLAVFMDPGEVARERHEVRASLRTQKQERRAARLPGWARDVD